MKYLVVILITLSLCQYARACDCTGISIKKGYQESSDVVLGKTIKAELKYYLINALSKDSIQNHYGRLVPNDTISYIEYTVQIIKSFKESKKTKNLIIRTEADGSNCDIKLKVGDIYMIYGYNNWWENLYYPNDKYFVLSSTCVRTTQYWKKEQKELEEFLRKKE